MHPPWSLIVRSFDTRATVSETGAQEKRQIMADPHDKVPGQPSGRYYVDSQCIDCDLCRETAPANFVRNDEEGFSYVFKQPESEEEETLCKDALDNCPVEAIGNDGS
jgi:ferredoxin